VVGVSAGFFFGAIDWRMRQVRVAQVNNTHYNKQTTVRQGNAIRQMSVNPPGAWHNDPDRRRGLSYRSAGAQQRFDAASAPPDRGTRAADGRPRAPVEVRRTDTRTGAGTHAHPQPVQPAHAGMRIEARRPDARPENRTGVLPARATPFARPGREPPTSPPRQQRCADARRPRRMDANAPGTRPEGRCAPEDEPIGQTIRCSMLAGRGANRARTGFPAPQPLAMRGISGKNGSLRI